MRPPFDMSYLETKIFSNPYVSLFSTFYMTAYFFLLVLCKICSHQAKWRSIPTVMSLQIQFLLLCVSFLLFCGSHLFSVYIVTLHREFYNIRFYIKLFSYILLYVRHEIYAAQVKPQCAISSSFTLQAFCHKNNFRRTCMRRFKLGHIK